MGNLVAIVGRPNVGKSTLFNRLTKTRQAIVNEEAGTTRDRQYGKTDWCGEEFSVVDTGGWVVNSDDVFEEEIRKQVILAIEEADVILFVVDVVNGVTDLDMEVASILRRSRTPIILVANKTDNNDLQYNAAEFYSLGLGDPYCISALSGSGTGDLLDLILSKFQKSNEESLEEDIPRFAIVGRPNAGKSSIINAFMGEERNIVTEIAGTTRDSIYTRYNKFGFDFYLVDEAFSVGDVVFRQKATAALQHLKKQSSLIYVSHSINSVKAHCDRGAVLNNGILHSYDNLAEAITEYTRICHDRSNKAAA